MIWESFLCWISQGSPSDWILAIATLMLAFAAIAGLSTWREQLHGTSKYVAAKEALSSVLLFRDALERIRDSARYASDFTGEYKQEAQGVQFITENQFICLIETGEVPTEN